MGCGDCRNDYQKLRECVGRDCNQKLNTLYCELFKNIEYPMKNWQECVGCDAVSCSDCYGMSKCAQCDDLFCYECTADHNADISRCKQSKQQTTKLQVCKWNEYDFCNDCYDEITKL